MATVDSLRIYRVMISSTSFDLPDHRAAVFDVVWRCEMYPSAMEKDTATSSDAMKYSLGLVDQADVYLGIFGFRYGYIPDGFDYSITEQEYRRAVERRIPILIFIMGEDHPIKARDIENDPQKSMKLQSLKEELKKKYVVGFFQSIDDLTLQVFQALSDLRIKGLIDQGNSSASLHSYTVSAIPSPPQPYFAHPYILTSKFIGRSRELAIIDDWAKSDDTTLIITAIGGVGKSALTWQWVKERAKQKIANLAGVIWWSFYESDATMSNFVRHLLAYITKQPLDSFDTWKNEEREQAVLNSLRREPYLLVLDGLERILVAYHRSDAAHLLDEQVEQMSPELGIGYKNISVRRCIDPHHGKFLSQLIGCVPSKILISTRLLPVDVQDTNTRQLLPGARYLSVGGLNAQDALILMNYLGVYGTTDKLKLFMSQFGYHSLLLKVIAGRIINYYPARGNFDVWYEVEGKYLHLAELNLAQRRTNILQYALNDLSSELARLLSAIAAFRYPVDYAALNALNPYTSFSLEEFQTISIEEFQTTSAKNQARFHAALLELEERGLLQWDRVTYRYDLHPVVRAYAYEQLSEEDRRNTYIRIRDHFATRPPEDLNQVQDLSDLRRTLEIYNAQIGAGNLDKASTFYEERLNDVLSTQLSAYYTIIELLTPLFKKEGIEEVHHLPFLTSARQQSARTNDLANAYSNVGGNAQALVLEALVLELEIRRKNVRRVGIILNNYGVGLIKDNQLAAALHTHELAYDLARAVQDEAGQAFSHFYFLTFYADTGQWKKAKEAYQQFKKLLPAQKATYWQASAERAFAQMLIYQGQDASKELEHAWQLAEQSHSALDLLEVQFLRGEAALQANQPDIAINSFQEAMNIAQKIDLPLGKYFCELSRAYIANGQGNDARSVLEQTLDQRQDESPLCVAEVYLALNEIERAKKYALKAYKEAWADGPPFSWWYKLERAKLLIDKLHLSKPFMPPFAKTRIRPIPFEEDIRTLIQESKRKKS